MTATPSRTVLLVAHTGRAYVHDAAEEVVSQLRAAGLQIHVLADEAAELELQGTRRVGPADACAPGVELVVVLGGDGTILRGAELARDGGIPVLGVNLGRVGFLAEAERADLHSVVEAIAERRYTVEERMTLDVTVRRDGSVLAHQWALNDVSVEKADRGRLLDIALEVDGRPLSTWGCDGVVAATPTGSTAYAFSAGGPVVWPEVEALLLVPLSAHALFARPLVAAPTSTIAVEILEVGSEEPCAVMWADGRRRVDLPAGSRVEVRRGEVPVRLARLKQAPFTDRLVAKFQLPVRGWRGPPNGSSA
ncbi:NAD kinase [Motilibacter deserti]|uniref:NAD kinase n=1 Tax=Motilibacter deserti TaxID=2714956 RepID=UPI002F2B6D47